METALGKRLNPEEMDLLGRRLISKYTSFAAAMREMRVKRAKWKAHAEGDYGDRKTTDETSIFSKSNIPLEFVTGVADFMVARTCEDIFGSDPYFSVIPQGPADDKLSQQLPKHFGYKLGEARFKPLGRQAIWRGFHLGEGLIKSTWRKTVDKFESLEIVLCGKKAEVLDENGDFIFAGDTNLRVAELGLSLWAKGEIARLEGEFADVPEVSPIRILVDEQGRPVKSASGDLWFEHDVREVKDAAGAVEFLCKGPIVSQGPEEDFAERLIEDETVIFEGLDISLVEVGDFVAPLALRHLGESGATFHRLSLHLSELREQYGLSQETEARLHGDDERPKNDAKRPQTGEGAVAQDVEDDDPQFEVIECYARVDIGGRMARVYALVERQSEVVIACDYLANVTPDAITPFAAIVPCPVPGRWYGRGYHEIYENQGDFIDRTFNGIIYRNKISSNPPMFIRDQAFKDGSVAKNFVIQAGKAHHLNNDYTAEQAVQFAKFPDLDSRTWKILELVMQMAQVRSGVTGAAQGAVTNLPANGTATGVQSIMMSGSVLHKLPIEGVKDGLEDSLNISAAVLYANQNRDETFTYMEGDATELITLNAHNVRSLKLNIRLLLTRLHERESLESAKAAIEAVMQYLNAVPEAEKDQVRSLFIQVLKALRITGADAILRHSIPPAQGETPPQHTERFNLSINYKDAPADIQRQMEQDAGYQPSALPPPEVKPETLKPEGMPGAPEGPETVGEQAGDVVPEALE